MATRIEVSVDRGGLLERNKQQTAANRQAQLERNALAQAGESGRQQREQRLASERRTEQGANRPSTALLEDLRDRPAAQRLLNKPGVSLAWIFSRLKEQPLYFADTTGVNGPCGTPVSYSATQTLVQKTQKKIQSGDGAVEYMFDYGIDRSQRLSRVGLGNDLTAQLPSGYARCPTGTLLYGPIAGGSDFSRSVGWEVWFPVGPGLLLYSLQSKQYDVIQRYGIERWTNCVSSSVAENIFSVDAPTLFEDTKNVCLLVGQSDIKELTPPSGLLALLETTQASWSINQTTTTITPSSSSQVDFFYEGSYVSSPITIPAYEWVEAPALTSIQTLFNNRTQKYSIAGTLPSAVNGGSNYVVTPGAYKNFATSATNYNAALAKAPTATNVNDASGFGAGANWNSVYDTATEFKHLINQQPNRTNKLRMSANKLGRPVDDLTYVAPEGFSLTASWATSVALGYDWQNARYCREQLLALGFSSLDLKL